MAAGAVGAQRGVCAGAKHQAGAPLLALRRGFIIRTYFLFSYVLKLEESGASAKNIALN